MSKDTAPGTRQHQDEYKAMVLLVDDQAMVGEAVRREIGRAHV